MKFVLTEKNKNGMRICHIADIHWRGLTRHSEYRVIFEQIFEKLKVIKPDVIYIGGDIFHTKTQNISPEVLEQLDWWFNSMTEIADVVVTLGNHDGNLMNYSRQDAITPVINMLNQPTIKLYKQSGNYNAVNDRFVWNVFSCFDVDGWTNVKPVPGKINIATFHGAVVGSTTDANYMLKGEVDTSFFNGYDFVLLGDIHKMQHLAYRKCNDGVDKPWISYCGSTIQQNYAETSEHGFLIWDIRDRDDYDVTFVPIENKNRFITVDWQGNVDDTLKCILNEDPHARYRIRSDGTIHQADWRRLAKALKSTKQAIEVVPKVEKQTVTSAAAIDNIRINDMHDICDINVLLNLVKVYCSEQKYSNETWSIVENKIGAYIKGYVDAADVTRNVKWSIDKLAFSNTFSYGENNTLNFAAMSGITGIFAGNAVGKSSIIGTIMYALFNATDRGPIKNLHIINIRKDECIAKVELTIAGRKHHVVRSSTKRTTNAGVTNASTTLNFTAIDTGEQLDGEQRNITEKRLRGAIGSADDFMLTTLAVQGGMKNFISEGASQRKTILYRFLDLQIFEQIHEQAKSDANAIKAQMYDMPERDWAAMKNKVILHREQCNNDIEKYNVEITKLREELINLQLEFANLTSIEQSVTQTAIDKQQNIINTLEKQLSDAIKNHDKTIITLDVTNDIVRKIDSVIKSFPFDELSKREQQRFAAQSALQEVNAKLKSVTEKHKIAKSHVAKLDVVPCGDLYPTCRYIKDAHIDKQKLPELENDIANTSILCDDKLRILNELSDNTTLKKLKRFVRIRNSRNRYSDKIERLNITKELHDNNFKNFEQQLTTAKQLFEDMSARLLSSSDVDKYSRITTAINNTNKLISDFEFKRAKSLQDTGKSDALLEQIINEQKQFVKLTAEWRAHECIMSATSKRAIPSQLLRYFIPVINDEIAMILNGIVGFTITLDVPEDSNAMEVYIDYGDSARLIELGSGMEKMIASIVIRVALTNISSLPKTDMLIIDEGFSELDETNIEACCSLLRSLTRYYKNIIIITHIEAMKDVVDHVIDITREGMDAYVTVE